MNVMLTLAQVLSTRILSIQFVTAYKAAIYLVPAAISHIQFLFNRWYTFLGVTPG